MTDISPPIRQDRVLIAVPCFQTISVPTAASIIGILRNDAYIADAEFKESIYVHNNRNDLVESALGGGYSHIFFVDRDMMFPPDTLQKLLELDKDVAAGIYNYRHLPLQPILFIKNKEAVSCWHPDMVPDKPFQAWGVGTGCMLIKTKVFTKIQKPYFDFKFTEDGKAKQSEDMCFCEKLEQASIEIWCEPRIKIGHIGEYIF